MYIYIYIYIYICILRLVDGQAELREVGNDSIESGTSGFGSRGKNTQIVHVDVDAEPGLGVTDRENSPLGGKLERGTIVDELALKKRLCNK